MPGVSPKGAGTDTFEVYWTEREGKRAFIGNVGDPMFQGGTQPDDREAAKKYQWVVDKSEATIISEPNKIIMTNLIKKFNLLTKSEPEKTFIKAGVTDDNGTMTSEGLALFNAFMLSKHGNEFKKEVVDKILEEEEKSK